MNWHCWGGMALLLLGCDGRLVVGPTPARVDSDASGGTSGASGASGGTSGASGGTSGASGGTSGASGGTSGAGGRAGTLGRPCIPSTTETSAKGTVAQADVTRLEHCQDGLSCGADGVCSAAPDCPQLSGLCVVRRAAADGYGDLGNAGSSSGGFSNTAGAGGAGLQPAVVALTADDTHLYWVEYGTRDSLGNYQGNGALMSFAFDGGETRQLATGLPGPVGLGVTRTHAYAFVDGGPLLGSPIHSQLLRLPLAGGTPEVIQEDVEPISFLGVGEQAFWISSKLSTIYSDAPSESELPTVFFAAKAFVGPHLAADATNLYFPEREYSPTNSPIDTLHSAPLAGGAAQLLGVPFELSFGAKDDALYGIEDINNRTAMLLAQVPKTGGAPQRVRALGAGGNAAFKIAGNRYFWTSNPPLDSGPYADRKRIRLHTASFAAEDSPSVVLLDTAVPGPPSPIGERSQAFWVGTQAALYWTDGAAIYSLSVADLP